ncbi:MAG: hypothetical protein ACLGI7_00675, partial [Gammaproteobacteria bacterium]
AGDSSGGPDRDRRQAARDRRAVRAALRRLKPGAGTWAALAGWVREGRLQWKTHVVDGLENAPAALGLLFSGAHDGKLLVRIADE